MFARPIRIIVLSTICLLIVLNLVFFTITQNGGLGNDWTVITVFNPQPSSHFEYRGLRYVYDYVSTFPGLTNCMNNINFALNVLTSQFDVTGYSVVNAIFGVLLLLVSPITVLVTFALDVINNLIWLFGFFIPNFH